MLFRHLVDAYDMLDFSKMGIVVIPVRLPSLMNSFRTSGTESWISRAVEESWIEVGRESASSFPGNMRPSKHKN